HHHVEQDEIGPVHVQHRDEAQPVRRHVGLVPGELERCLQHLARLPVVVDDDDLAPHGHRRGVLPLAQHLAGQNGTSSPPLGPSPASGNGSSLSVPSAFLSSTSTLRSASSRSAAPARESRTPSSNSCSDCSSVSDPPSSF